MTTDDTPPPRQRVQPDPLHDRLVAKVADLASYTWDSSDRVHQALLVALAVAKENEHGALRWEDQLQVPEWVRELRVRVAIELGVPT